jgi:phosphatidylserine/phosphatidylglycerophosphate/cardiolipin synthase-like enzyme
VNSNEWDNLNNNPRITIYQTGKLYSILLGKGKTYYGKLHAKFILGFELVFIGTSNFDYRSNLYNNKWVLLLTAAKFTKGWSKFLNG